MTGKLYYSIGEVATMLGEAPSTLRFWEQEFSQIKPTKNNRGARSYTEKDIELLQRIQYLTRERGYTLDGVREQLRTRPVEDPRTELAAQLGQLRRFLVELKEAL